MKPSLLFTLSMLYTILRLEPSVLAATRIWTSIGPDGGHVQAIAIDPQTSATVFIVSGGAIFKSTDGAANWKRVYSPANRDGIANPAIVVAIDPRDSNTVYAGATDGLLKSADGGASWSMVSNGLPNPHSIPNILVRTTGVKLLAIDPRNPETVYAGVAIFPDGGDPASTPDLFKSTDGGASWFPVSSGLTGDLVRPDGTHVAAYLNVSSIAIDSQNSNTLYVAANGRSPGGIFKSTDGGATWSLSSSGLAVVALAIDPRNPNTLYAAGDGIFKSKDGGATWSAANSGLPEFILSLAVDPQTPDTLYAAPAGCSYPSCRYSQVFRSTDGGTSWNGAGLSPSSSPAVLAIDPTNSNTLYAGVFNGLVKSMDAGVTWNASNSGLIASQIDSLALDPQTPGALFATVHGKVLKTADLGANWSEISTPLPSVDGRETDHASTLVADPAAPDTFYLAFRGYADGGGILKTADSGANWKRLSLPQGFGGSGVRDLRMDPRDSSTLYASSPNRVLEKSADGGASWNEIAGWNESAAGAPGQCFEPMAIDPRDSSTLYVGGCLSGIFKSTDGGQTWTSFAIPLTSSAGTLAIDPQNSATIYVSGYYDGILKTTDGGKNWKVMSSGLPTMFSAGFIAFDPQNSNIVYAAIGGRGIFWSNNGGANWSPLNDGLTTLNVRRLLIDPRNPYTIYAGTSDGGVFAMTSN